jgi:hypothetical protein
MKLTVKIRNGTDWETVTFDTDELDNGTLTTTSDLGWTVIVMKD